MATLSDTRFSGLDTLRGLAMVWMTVFHACFDLQHFGYLQANFYADPFWTWQRVCIVSLFTFCAGAGQAIAVLQGQDWSRFWKRWRQIALCAALVSVGSYLMYPKSFIYFGILHGIAAMLIVVRLSAGWGKWLWLLGGVAIELPILAPIAHEAIPALEVLNTPAMNWLGLISHKPVTEDYAPLLPWLGPMWWGMAAGRWCAVNRPHWLNGAGPNPLAVLGHWSLSYYMVHQPVLIGALTLVGAAGAGSH